MKEVLKLTLIFLIITTVVTGATIFFDFKRNEPETTYSIKLLLDESNNWFYEIYDKGSLIIKQPTIPAAPGHQKFNSKKDAELIGKLVIFKLESKIPPHITLEELEENYIIFKQ